MDKDQLLSIGRPQKICMNCNGPLGQIERHPSILKAARKNSIERLDYCPECWQQMKDEAYESFWITRRVIRERKIRLTRKERNAALRVLFESLWDRRETEDVTPHLYFLAHLMMKWGGLRWKENLLDPAGKEIVVFEDPASGDRLEIAGVNIDDERMTIIQQEIEAFIHEYAPDEDPSGTDE